MKSVDKQDAIRRRKALARVLSALGILPADLARICGLNHATGIYNFLNGRTNSLAMKTYEKFRFPWVYLSAFSLELNRFRKCL